MSSSRPICSIVIRAYNEASHINKLLTGIKAQTFKDFEIILVDSGSTDGTISNALNFPVKVVNIRPEDFTFGYSLNQGIMASRGEFVVIASAHVFPTYPDWLEQLLAPFSDPKIALTYGKQRGAAETQFSENQIFKHWFPDESVKRQLHPFCNNANAAIRRALWEKHPYDETLTGLEDLDWGKWAIEQGYFISYVAEAEIIHVHNETPRRIFNRYRREAMTFKRIFPDERFNFGNFLRLTTTNIFSDLFHAGRERLLLRHLGKICAFRFMQFWGTYHGYQTAGPLTAHLRRTFYYPRALIDEGERLEKRQVVSIRY